MTASAPIADIVGRELAQTVDPAAMDLAAAARGKVADVRAVLFYGSCLRDGLDVDAVADLYLLVGSCRASGQSRVAAIANRMLPPNVIYIEVDSPKGRLRAKAAILSLDQFRRLTGDAAFHSYFWARFAQPVALIWTVDAATRDAVERAVVSAIRTFAAECASGPLRPDDARDFWVDGFRNTYRSELRAEGPGRAAALYEADRARYDDVYAALAAAPPQARATPSRWRRRRWLGKALSVARLLKGVFTFDGGLDYILWKIARHSGVRVEAKPWQRRWPLVAAPGLALTIWRRGGFR